MTTYRAALAAARAALGGAGSESPALDARLLLAAAAGVDGAAVIARNAEPLPALAEAAFDAYLRRRLAGEPVARILGEKEFWGLRFQVGEATLVPRPETEILVESVLAECRARFAPDVGICDLGTGSGAIVVALLTELPRAHGTGSDISAAALAVARKNAERLGVAARISFYEGDFGEGPDGRFDVVVSNPPYIRTQEIAALAPEVRDHDPRAALDGGSDGLDAYRTILARAPLILKQGGVLAFEVGFDQAQAVAALCRSAGLRDPAIRRDLAGRDRVVVAALETPGAAGGLSKKALGKVAITG